MLEYYYTKKHYHTLDYYLKNKYQKKVFKIPLNASFTCPNRDGSKGLGGCLFCSEQGSGDFAGNPTKSLNQQFEEIKNIMENKWKDGLYIAYFQAFSNTYGSIEKLKKTFEPFIHKENVIGMSIATRCDCINEQIVRYLKTLKPYFKEFWIELGLQSANAITMKKLNLKYTLTDFKKAVKLLHQAGIDVIVHIIDGLLDEDEQMQLNTIKQINKLPIKGIKIHVLNILKNSKLAPYYLNGTYQPISQEKFIDIAIKQLCTLRSDIIVHRLGADSSKEELLAPIWTQKKLAVVDQIDQIMVENDLFQGENV